MPGYGGGGDGAQPGYGDLQEGYGGKDAAKPQCPPGQTGVTKQGYQAYGNGCGTAGIKVSSEFDFEDCCTYTHDVCYVTCGMPKSKCESLFGDCMKDYCKKNHPDRLPDCNSNGQMYTMGTTLMGGKYYKEGQDEACDCVPDAEAPARQKEELQSFYKKWQPDQISKADSLYKKYKDNFPRLRMMLNQKYKHSVKVIKSDDDSESPMKLNVQSGSKPEVKHTEL